MKALPLKIIFLFAFTYGSTSGLSTIGKSVQLEIRKVDSTNNSAAQPEIHVLDEVKTASEFRDQPKDGEPSGVKRNPHSLDEGRGKKKKKIKGALFLMMVAMGVKCIMVLKALTVKALLASKIALVLSLLSIMKKLFEKPEQKPQTNIVLKREPEHHYSRNDYNSRIDNGDYWLQDPHERLSQGYATRMRLPLAKGVFDNWRGRYYSPRGAYMDKDEELGREYTPKRKKERPCNCGKGYLLGSLERGTGALDHQASEHENKIANYDLTKSRKIVPTQKSNNYMHTLEGINKYPNAKMVVKNQYESNSKTNLRDRNMSDNKLKVKEEHNSRESNINKGMINHYDNDVFQGTDWENIKRPNVYAKNNGFQDGRSTQVFANWDAYKKFFGHLRSANADSERPIIVSSGSEIRNRHSYKHRRGA